MECYSAMKSNEVNIMLNESQTQNDIYCMIPLYEISKISKSIKTESRVVVAYGNGEISSEC